VIEEFFPAIIDLQKLCANGYSGISDGGVQVGMYAKESIGDYSIPTLCKILWMSN
jgi:hypothetical protein